MSLFSKGAANVQSAASALGQIQRLGGGAQTLSDPYGNHVSHVAGYDIHELERAIAQSREKSAMIESGDLIVRKARNGYRILVAAGQGAKPDEYVAKDLDEVHEVLKLASANMRIDAAK